MTARSSSGRVTCSGSRSAKRAVQGVQLGGGDGAVGVGEPVEEFGGTARLVEQRGDGGPYAERPQHLLVVEAGGVGLVVQAAQQRVAAGGPQARRATAVRAPGCPRSHHAVYGRTTSCVPSGSRIRTGWVSASRRGGWDSRARACGHLSSSTRSRSRTATISVATGGTGVSGNRSRMSSLHTSTASSRPASSGSAKSPSRGSSSSGSRTTSVAGPGRSWRGHRRRRAAVRPTSRPARRPRRRVRPRA